MNKIEHILTSPLTALGPWLLALAPSYIAWSALVSLGWPTWLCWIIAGAIEVFGTTATTTALELRDYNSKKRKLDPEAPEKTAWAMTAVYILAVSVFCGLHASPALAPYSLILWPIMGAAAMIVRALRQDHLRRQEQIKVQKLEQKKERETEHSAPVRNEPERTPRQEAIVQYVTEHPFASVNEIKEGIRPIIETSKTTVYNELTLMGLKKNGDGQGWHQ